MTFRAAVVDALIEAIGCKVGSAYDYLASLRGSGPNIGRAIPLVISMKTAFGGGMCDDVALLRRSIRTQLQMATFALLKTIVLAQLP